MIERSGSSPGEITAAAQRLAAGRLVAFPTETVYGLGANASDDSAVAKIFATKNRPVSHPLIVHIAAQSEAHHFAVDVPDFAQALMSRFWPGPLTLILKRRDGVANASAGQHPTIGLRCPDHPVALALLRAAAGLGVHGISGPSANPFGRISPTTADHVAALFADTVLHEPLLVIDGGACSVGIESTIIDCTRRAPVLLRPGGLDAAAIAQACGRRVLMPTDEIAAAIDAPHAPGTLAQHYKPRAHVRLMNLASLQAGLDVLGEDAKNLAIYARGAIQMRSSAVILRRMPDDAAACAQQLFATLHAFDDAKVKLIWIEAPPNDAAWDGVRDRLMRASAG